MNDKMVKRLMDISNAVSYESIRNDFLNTAHIAPEIKAAFKSIDDIDVYDALDVLEEFLRLIERKKMRKQYER